jgi:Uma2 family endonuclease
MSSGSAARYRSALDASGHLRRAPELVVEVLSPGAPNERRDREAKLHLYSRRGVDDYWIVDWSVRTVDVYRQRDGRLQLVGRFVGDQPISSPVLLGFSATADDLFRGLA